MLYAYGNMLEMECDVLVVTTNGFVKSNGECVMGKGIAKQVAQLYPMIPRILGNKILRFGNKIHYIHTDNEREILSFPVKDIKEPFNGHNAVGHMANKFKLGDMVPGWACKARLDIIERSLIELVDLCDKIPEWQKILIPRVGCGAGELDFETVRPLMESYLDDRFFCCTFRA